MKPSPRRGSHVNRKTSHPTGNLSGFASKCGPKWKWWLLWMGRWSQRRVLQTLENEQLAFETGWHSNSRILFLWLQNHQNPGWITEDTHGAHGICIESWALFAFVSRVLWGSMLCKCHQMSRFVSPFLVILFQSFTGICSSKSFIIHDVCFESLITSNHYIIVMIAVPHIKFTNKKQLWISLQGHTSNLRRFVPRCRFRELQGWGSWFFSKLSSYHDFCLRSARWHGTNSRCFYCWERFRNVGGAFGRKGWSQVCQLPSFFSKNSSQPRCPKKTSVRGIKFLVRGGVGWQNMTWSAASRPMKTDTLFYFCKISWPHPTLLKW